MKLFPWSRSREGRRLVALLVALLLSLAGLQAAIAHVGVNPNQVAANTFTTFTIRVPTEKDEPTVKVRIEFPADLVVSRFQPKAGWQREIETDARGRIAAAIWSGGQIGPNEYEEFTFLARTPDEPGRLSFPAYQTYQGGETVAWIEGEEGEYPAPVVEITGAVPSHATDVAPIEDAVTTQPSDAPTATAATSAVTTVPPSAPTVGQTQPASGTPAAQQLAPAPVAAPTESAGSDLPLFAVLGSLAVSLTALVIAATALLRRAGM